MPYFGKDEEVSGPSCCLPPRHSNCQAGCPPPLSTSIHKASLAEKTWKNLGNAENVSKRAKHLAIYIRNPPPVNWMPSPINLCSPCMQTANTDMILLTHPSLALESILSALEAAKNFGPLCRNFKTMRIVFVFVFVFLWGIVG